MEERRSLIGLGGNGLFMLLVLLFVVDPTNTILGLKNMVFALLFLYSIVFFKADWSKLIYFIIPAAAISLSWVIASMRGHNMDGEELKGVYTALVPLLLLMWVDKYDVVRLSVLPVTVGAIIVLSLFWLIFFVPQLEGPIYEYMWQHDGTIMMSNRIFLGFKIFCMYPKSTAAFMPVFGYVLYKAVDKEQRKWVFVVVALLLLHMFVISGTRSSVLLPVFFACSVLFIFCRNGRFARYIFYPAAIIFFVMFIVVLMMLLMEKDEPSNLVKYAHLASYKELFNDNPEYLLLGQGPATEFYSIGFRKMTLKTEWTYLELLRNYGMLCLPILYVILRPLFELIKLSFKYDSALTIAAAYIIYLVIAGTNPLLLSSTGMLVILSAYSFLEHLKKKTTV